MTDTSPTKSRFSFGENWSKFLPSIDESRIRSSEVALQTMLEVERLDGATFLDIGSGSGLSSFAARRLGARVHSFDYDDVSVACTRRLRDQYSSLDRDWAVEQGSILDRDYVASLGTFDIVYSWGVLHHTGRMWEAIDNAATLVRPGGRFFIAIYNDQGRPSAMWKRVKRWYNTLPPPLRFLVLWPAALRLWLPTTIRDLVHLRPFRTWREYKQVRGMSAWRDVVDWVGGYPFEVAKPEQIFERCRDKGFRLTRMKTNAGGLACNEYVFTLDR